MFGNAKRLAIYPTSRFRPKQAVKDARLATVSDGLDRPAVVEHAEADKMEGKTATSKPPLIRF